MQKQDPSFSTMNKCKIVLNMEVITEFDYNDIRMG